MRRARRSFSPGHARRLWRALKGELAGRAFVAPCNLAVPRPVDELLKKAEAAAGAPIDILVNNAGITRDNLSCA